MSLLFDFLTIDCRNPKDVARFWEQALPAYQILVDDDDDDDPDEPEEVLLLPTDRRGPKILFVGDGEGQKVGKNRLHFDLRPETDRDAEVARLEGLGAKRVDIGQGEVSWIVMADIEGNEFCVLRALTEEEKVKWADWVW